MKLQSTVTERYEALENPMGLRKQRLLDSLRVQQLFRDVEDEEAWIREKEPIAASTNRGRDLIGVQNLIKKHQAVLAEMHNHEPHVLAVCQAGYQMADDGHFAADEVRKRIQTLADHWAYLKEKALQRKQGSFVCLVVCFLTISFLIIHFFSDYFKVWFVHHQFIESDLNVNDEINFVIIIIPLISYWYF